jgi:hypothetical protein
VKGIKSKQIVLDLAIERKCWQDNLFADVTSNSQKYQGDPIAFVEECLGDTLTIEQKQILDRLIIGGEINVQAAHGVGKSFIASRIVAYQTLVVGTETITTAPTFRQVKNVLWKEVRKLSAKLRAVFAGIELGQVFMRSGNGSAFGFTAQHNSTDAFQGQHAPGLGVIIDEACGVSNEIDEGAIACAVDAGGFILRIGNPTNPNTAFGKACKGTQTIRIPVWNHPNVVWAYDRDRRLLPWIVDAIGLREGKCNRRSQWAGQLKNLRDPVPGAVSIEWIEKVRFKFGVESAYWQSRVCAEFPDNISDGIIPLSWLRDARDRYDRDPEYWDALASSYFWQFGADVADGGGDNHAIAYFGGRSVLYGVRTIVPLGDYQDTLRLAKILGVDVASYGDVQIAIDNLGVGAGTLAKAIELGLLAQACTFSNSPTRKPDFGTSYRNLRTQVYWEFREALQRKELAIASLGTQEDAAFEELSAVEYTINASGVIIASSKAEVKQKIGRSPDRADAIVMAHWLSPLSKGVATPFVGAEAGEIDRAMQSSGSDNPSLDRVNWLFGNG